LGLGSTAATKLKVKAKQNALLGRASLHHTTQVPTGTFGDRGLPKQEKANFGSLLLDPSHFSVR
jgi:hypothetical protein